MVLSDLTKSGLESGVCIDEYNYQNKDKKQHYEKYESFFFFCAVYHSITRSVIAAILDAILYISKCRKQQQYASLILQIQPLLKII